MLLRVQYKTAKYDMIKDSLLNQLIASGKIAAFQRSTGWVLVGRDPVRGDGAATKDLKDKVVKEAAAS